jgi:hypothetical protein
MKPVPIQWQCQFISELALVNVPGLQCLQQVASIWESITYRLYPVAPCIALESMLHCDLLIQKKNISFMASIGMLTSYSRHLWTPAFAHFAVWGPLSCCLTHTSMPKLDRPRPCSFPTSAIFQSASTHTRMLTACLISSLGGLIQHPTAHANKGLPAAAVDMASSSASWGQSSTLQGSTRMAKTVAWHRNVANQRYWFVLCL